MVRDNPEQVLVFEDDAIPHLNFKVLFKELPSRCLEADLLLLGAGIWHSKHTQWPSGACFDADDATFGAYALLIKRICYGPILSWLQRETPRPYDHLWEWLLSSAKSNILLNRIELTQRDCNMYPSRFHHQSVQIIVHKCFTDIFKEDINRE
ncbi:unnamed protein product [Rotaria sp. Silwood1]|nr:unnamed protein product [Rotaria sp. Silwood1]